MVGGGGSAAWVGGGAAALVGAAACNGGGGGGVVRGADAVRGRLGGGADRGGVVGAWTLAGWMAAAGGLVVAAAEAAFVGVTAALWLGVLETDELFAAGREHPASVAIPTMGSTIKARLTTMSARRMELGTER